MLNRLKGTDSISGIDESERRFLPNSKPITCLMDAVIPYRLKENVPTYEEHAQLQE